MKENKFRIPRIWSNNELKRFGHLFYGKVGNISGWQDNDKEGKKYKEYFINASEYWITNYKTEARGFQGDQKNEIFIDLSLQLNLNLYDKFDVVFNHTVLEHIFELDIAFANICNLTSDIAIIVVPFLQEQHAEYGDYWRFTPQALDKLFKINNMKTMYINFNDCSTASIYIFAIGSKYPEKWSSLITMVSNKIDYIYDHDCLLGKSIINEPLIKRIINRVKKFTVG